MGWITQSYEGNVHVVPDTEPGHVLGPDCFCVPAALMENEAGGLLVMHHDELDRTTASTSAGSTIRQAAPLDARATPSAPPSAPSERTEKELRDRHGAAPTTSKQQFEAGNRKEPS